MASDLETTTDDVYNTIRQMWQEAQPGMSDNDASGFGQAVVSVPDTAIAERTGLDLEAVREFLDNADGTRLTVARDGESRSVTSIVER
jgi:hypothetical protein